MENLTKKLGLIQEALIHRIPDLKEKFGADPSILENIFTELPLEIHWRRPDGGTLTHEEEEVVKEEFYPQVQLLFKYLKPLWKLYENLADRPTKLQKEALSHLKNNPDKFSSINEKHLNNICLFQWPINQQPRHFCGTLLKVMVTDIYQKKIGAVGIMKLFQATK
jgi:hypothetical protein